MTKIIAHSGNKFVIGYKIKFVKCSPYLKYVDDLTVLKKRENFYTISILQNPGKSNEHLLYFSYTFSKKRALFYAKKKRIKVIKYFIHNYGLFAFLKYALNHWLKHKS
jgi:hypothetical protein